MKNILFLGCGKMGSIVAKNLFEHNSFKTDQISVVKRSEENKIDQLSFFKNTSELPDGYLADVIFLAIKPQDSEETFKKLSESKILSKNTIFISLLAGKKVEFFEKIFGKNAKIVRSMPNLPIQDAQGIFTFFLNTNITKADSKKLSKLFSKFGKAFEIKDEKLFDPATALFGSGPAYIFALQEIFTEIAISHKIEIEDAQNLVNQLFLGSSLMSSNSNLNFTSLRENVVSKGGTTDAALQILQKNSALKNLFKDAINAACAKSMELSDK